MVVALVDDGVVVCSWLRFAAVGADVVRESAAAAVVVLSVSGAGVTVAGG